MDEQQVALFKLISGDELVTEYKADGEFYVLRAPRKIVLIQANATTVKPHLMAWMIGNANGVFPIHSSHVLTVSAEMDDGLKKKYISDITGLDLSATKPTKLVGV